jgi:ribosomal protein L9
MRHYMSPLNLLVLLQTLAVAAAFSPASLTTTHQRATHHARSLDPIIHGVVSNSILSPTSTVLFSKKKAAAASPAKGKVQVKLLKHVAGTGQAGEVIMVTPAFFNNKLRPTKSATMISDDEVAREQSEAEKQETEEIQIAEELQSKIEDLQVKMSRKAGPDGQLFGGINTKMIITEIQSLLKDDKDYLSQKNVKITDLLDEDGKKMRGDIKHTGTFSSKISLRKNISAKFDIIVDSEN